MVPLSSVLASERAPGDDTAFWKYFSIDILSIAPFPAGSLIAAHAQIIVLWTVNVNIMSMGVVCTASVRVRDVNYYTVGDDRINRSWHWTCLQLQGILRKAQRAAISKSYIILVGVVWRRGHTEMRRGPTGLYIVGRGPTCLRGVLEHPEHPPKYATDINKDDRTMFQQNFEWPAFMYVFSWEILCDKTCMPWAQKNCKRNTYV